MKINYQTQLLAAILGVSNCGVQLTGPRSDRQATKVIERLATATPQRRYRDTAENLAVDIVAHLCENDEMADGFAAEAKSFRSQLRKMKLEEVKRCWLDCWTLVENIKE